MKKLITICAIFLLITGSAIAGPTVYIDRSAWETTAGAYLEEDFDDGVLDPGISVVTDNGLVQAGSGVLGPDNVWWDRVIPGDATTTWSFATPLVGFGAYWDLAGPGGPGTGIALFLDGEFIGAEIVNSTEGEFFGITSTMPFNAVIVGAGTDPIGWAETYEMDNMVYKILLPVSVDIKPGGCPNPLNVKSKGVLPVAVLGTEDFDVSEVDVGSIRLAGVAPIRFDYEDVATPFEGELCDCHEDGPDGYLDLTLKFDTQEIVDALGCVVDGDELELILTGEDVGGILIEGSDCIRIIKKDD